MKYILMRTIKRIAGILTSVVVVLLFVLAISLVGVRLLGLTPYAVLTGSMEPTYPVGSMVYVKKVDPDELGMGDAITFLVSDDTVVTHRIVDVEWDTENNLWFSTKGDANKDVDAEPVISQNVLGKVVFSVPKLGYISGFVSTFPGKYITLGIVVILIAMALWPDDEDEKETDDEELKHQ